MADRDRPARAGDETEGFLSRWSRRKAKARGKPAAAPAPDIPVDAEDQSPGAETAPASREEARVPDAPPSVDPEDLPDIESLDASSDFTVFMRPGVPAHLRTLALRKLWRSDPIFSNLDGLVEYGEDYTIPSWRKGTIKTAYRIGRGFVNELEKLEDGKAKAGPSEQPDEEPAAIASSADEAPAESPVDPPQPAPKPPASKEAQPATSSPAAPAGASASVEGRRRSLPRRG